MSWFLKACLWCGWTDVGFLSCVVSPLFALFFPEGGPSTFSCWVFLMLNRSAPTPPLFPPIVAPIWRSVNDALEKELFFKPLWVFFFLQPSDASAKIHLIRLFPKRFVKTHFVYFRASWVRKQFYANFRGQLLVSYNKYSWVSVLIYSYAVAVLCILKG